MTVYNCEQNCLCDQKHEVSNLIVLTGGPGAGKTAVLEFVRKIFCKHVAILPEAATILFGGGFWRLDSESARRSAQKSICYVQEQMQELVLAEKRWALGLCDRGTLDGLAYWPGSEKEFFEILNTNKASEYAKYRAVIQLQSPSIENGYNHQNPVRIESAELAAKIDAKIHEVWKDHPNYHMIESTTHFIDKVNVAIQLISDFVPECCRGRKRGPKK